tara:strand:+ start:188 stop:568 length:381 start_codon:yes stop_codon:yes gene_type:complete
MSHHGLLIPEITMTPIRTQWSTVTSLTVSCTMYSAPLVETFEERTVDGKASTYGVTHTDEANKVELGTDSFTWSVPTAHQSQADPYVVNWKFREDRTNENHRKLIKASADYKTMMNGLTALQLTHE